MPVRPEPAFSFSTRFVNYGKTAMESRNNVVLGLGSAILDILANVDDDFLKTVKGEKGGMVMLSSAEEDALIGRLGRFSRMPGGSAANTMFGLQRLGMQTALLGKIGSDAEGEFYRSEFGKIGGDVSRFKVSPDLRTGRCVSLITPDSERTMRTDLAAASSFRVTEITSADLEKVRHVHLEGYMLYSFDVFMHVLKLAKEHGATVSLDLASFEVVDQFRDKLEDILRRYVNVVFANEDEARTLLNVSREDFRAEDAAAFLSELCPTAAVKLGKKGACIRSNGETVRTDAELVTAVDTTGAGDLWQAGFLYAWLNGYSMETAGKMGAILGAEVVQVIGASIPPFRWDPIRTRFKNLTLK